MIEQAFGQTTIDDILREKTGSYPLCESKSSATTQVQIGVTGGATQRRKSKKKSKR